MENVSINGYTRCYRLYEGYQEFLLLPNVLTSIFPRYIYSKSDFDAEDWDATARAYHNLKMIFNNHGLVSKVRRQHLRERSSRRREFKKSGDRLGWLYSLIAWQMAGYGISVSRVVRNMLIVFIISTVIYLYMGINNNYSTTPEILYYSIITFTTTPPEMPKNTIIKFIVISEAFLGTLLVVFLGYVLGRREQF